MQEDVTAIKLWASIFKDPALLKKTVIKHMALHSKQILGDISTAEAQWSDGEYFKSGFTVADLMTVAIGPIKPIYPPTFFSNDMEPTAVPDYVAGMIFAFTGNNQLPEMQQCFNGNRDMVVYAKNLAEDLKQQNWLHAVDNYQAFAAQLKSALAPCHTVDYQVIESWA